VKHFLFLLFLSAVVSYPPSVAHAFRISGVTATTDMGGSSGTLLANTVNGAGLSELTLTATHIGSTPTNTWISSKVTGQVTFDLGGSFQVDGFSFWNEAAVAPGLNGTAGIRGVNVLSSTDGSTFTPVPGAPHAFAKVEFPRPLEIPFFFAPEIFSFSAVTATHIRFEVLSNQGTPIPFTGFSEVGFNAVPEPTTASLLLLSSLAGAVLRRGRASS
jgi:hypothetical protein